MNIGQTMKRFYREWDSVITPTSVILVGTVAIFAFALALDRLGCEARWADSGRAHTWSVLGGCLVADKMGRMIPEKTLREMQ